MGRVQKVQKLNPPYHTRTRIRIRARLFMYARNAYNILRICGNRIMDKRHWEDIRFCPYSISHLYYTRACACVIGRGEFLYLLYPSCDEKK